MTSLTKTQNGIEVPLSKEETELFNQMELEHAIKMDAYALVKYKDQRNAEYPPINDLVIALWEQIIENRFESAASLQEKRLIVKQKYPKP